MRPAGFRRTAVVIASVLAVTGSVLGAGPATAAPPAAPAPEPVIELGTFRPDFSPNGDGYHDRLVIPVHLSRTATVALKVVDLETKKVLPVAWRICLRGGQAWCVHKPGSYRLTWEQITAPFQLRGYAKHPSRYALRLEAHRYPSDTLFPGPAARTEVWLTSGISIPPTTDVPTFSPNADGRLDKLSLPFDLEQRSRVRVAVRDRQGEVVLRADLGRLAAGRRTWTWAGHAADRRRVADERYTVRFAATPVARPSHTGTSTTDVVVDTTVSTPELKLSRSVVYPRASVIADSIRGVVGDDYDDDSTTTVAVRTPSGRLVKRLSLTEVACYLGPESDGICQATEWDGRNAQGSVVPTGRYDLRVARQDLSGNRAIEVRTVTVSDGQLVERTGSITWTSDKTPRWQPFCMGNHCGEGPPYWLYGYSWDPAFGATPADRYRLTVTGTPAAPGSTGTTTLNFGTYGPTPGSVTLQGDQPITTPWTPVAPDATLLSDGRSAMWSVDRTGSGNPADHYQVSTFTLDFTYYEPVS